MADYYVDPAAGGANDGGGDGAANDPTDTDNWTDAWTDVQSAFDTAVVGDIVYCRGTQTLTAIIDIDTNEGDTTNGFIRFIGVEGLLGNTGTRFVLDGNSAVANCLKQNSMNFIFLENFECKNATGDGMEGLSPSTSGNVFVNCSFNTNGGFGFDGNFIRGSFLFRCTFFGNSSNGVNRGGAVYFFCSFHDNTGIGMSLNGVSSQSIGCLYYDNGNDGIGIVDASSLVFNGVINGNTDDGIVASRAPIIGCRITNHSGAGDIGLNLSDVVSVYGWNYYEDNDGANIQNGSVSIEILNDGASTEAEDQADTNEGYTDLTDGAEDFNLRSDATSRRTAITIPTV